MSKNKQNSDNYLNYMPCHNDKYAYKTDEEGNVTILIENKGLFNRIAQKLFKKPEITRVHLDEMGNFIWPLIDGKKSIYDIAMLVKEEFGENAEPLYNRLVTYMRNLERYGFVIMKKSGRTI